MKQDTKPTTYRVTFDRIGRNHKVEPLTATARHPDDLAEAIYRYARPHLGSRDVDVVVDLEELKGTVFCGIQVGSNFVVEVSS